MNEEKLEVIKEKLGVDEWLELIREDKFLYGAYISICQYVDLTEQENKRLKDQIKVFEDPEDLTLMFMYCDIEAKDKIKELTKNLDYLLNVQEENERLLHRVRELKKKLDKWDYENKLQQKEFIKYLEDSIDKTDYEINICGNYSYLAWSNAYKAVLSKYKKIVNGTERVKK